MKENFQIHIWLGLLLCLLGMSCSDDTPAKGDDPGNGNTELEVNEWIESVMRSDYLWNNDIPAQNKLDFSADPQTFFRSMLSLKDGKTRNGKHWQEDISEPIIRKHSTRRFANYSAGE
jgi:carboxyl-terminal processing protease